MWRSVQSGPGKPLVDALLQYLSKTLYVQYMASDGYNVANARMIFRHKGNVYEPQSDKSSERSSQKAAPVNRFDNMPVLKGKKNNTLFCEQ